MKLFLQVLLAASLSAVALANSHGAPPELDASSEQQQQQQSSAEADPSENETNNGEESEAPSAPAGVTRLTLVNAGNALRAPSFLVGSSRASQLQHTILPPETIPLPITIATRAGLRTVIAPETIIIQEPTIAKVGEVVHKIPTAVSHQSQTIVHQHARVVTPVVAPAVRTITQQVLRAYHTPLVYSPHAQFVRVLN